MTKKILSFTFVFLAFLNLAFAQDNITGKVVDETTNAPLSGATITEVATTNSTQTDENGNFTLKIKNKNGHIQVSFTGYAPKRVAINQLTKTSTIALVQDKENLEGVVVTAFGIKREKKALGFSVASVDKKQIELNPQNDLGRILAGKAPGLNILATSGLSGSGTNINIRGIATITGSSQPLFVIDGVPFDGGTNSTNFTFGNNQTSRFYDIDPNNIENVELLKSLAATTLYGELGVNGVVLITTKTGAGVKANKKAEITVSHSYNINQVANLPDYNRTYGGGFDLSVGFTFYSNWGGAFTNPATEIDHPYGLRYPTIFPQYVGTKYPVKFYNSVHDFFRSGNSNNTSIRVQGSGKDISYNASYNYLDEQGFLPGNSTIRNNFSFGGTAKLNNKFTLSGTINYVKSDVKSPPTSTSFGSGASNNSVFGDLLYTPTQVDLIGLPWELPTDHSSVYYRPGNDIQNPIWTLNNAFTRNQTDRAYGQVQLKFQTTDWLDLYYRTGFDNYNERFLYAVNKGGVEDPNGSMLTSNRENQIWDHTLYGHVNKEFNDDLSITADLGYNLRQVGYKNSGIISTQQLVYGIINQDNFINHSSGSLGIFNIPINGKYGASSIGYFGTATLNFRDWLYVSGGGRYSITSRLEKENASIFYPNLAISFVLTDAVKSLNNLKALNYLKFRFGYGTSARFPDNYYITRQALSISTRSFVTRDGTVLNTNSVQGTLANPDLKPELQEDFEFGVDGKLADNRVNFELSLYNKISNNQILPRDIDPATGYTSLLINAGQVSNKGIELNVGVAIIRTKNWNWKLDLLYSLNRSQVSKLPDDLRNYIYAGYTSLGNAAINGQQLGVILGSKILRDSASGERVVGPDGLYIYDNSQLQIIGDPNPRYRTTLINNLSWKFLNFRMQWEYINGGSMYSITSATLLGRGVTRDTEFDRAAPVIIPGVKQDGTPNNIQISSTAAYFNSLVGDAGELAVFDATVIRLRELSLGFTLPKEWIEKSPFGNISLSVAGQNLWYLAPGFPKYVNFDPETSGLGVGNGRGLEFITGPSSRRFGVSLNVTF